MNGERFKLLLGENGKFTGVKDYYNGEEITIYDLVLKCNQQDVKYQKLKNESEQVKNYIKRVLFAMAFMQLPEGYRFSPVEVEAIKGLQDFCGEEIVVIKDVIE